MENTQMPCPLKAFKNTEGKWGFMNPINSVIVISPVYDNASDFSEGLAAVELDGNYGYIDKTGQIVVPFVYNYAEDFDNGHATVYKPGTNGHEIREEIDIDGTLHLEIMEVDGLCGYADVEGNVVISAIYDEVMPFYEGLAAVRKGEKWGYIDKKGETVIPIIYRQALSFSEGLAAVSSFEIRGYGYIDKENKLVIPFRFDSANSFSDGIAVVHYDAGLGAEWCCINKKGEFIRIEDGVRHIMSPFSNGRAAIATSQGFGYIDCQGKLVVQPEYEDCGWFEDGCAVVMKDKKIGCIDINGNIVVPFVFDNRLDIYSAPRNLIERYLHDKEKK